ncbi:hypothetical protein C8Q77DRAFT_1080160 [Trametes polyzona]|nr:hypothetical protein C8Q77DRAFT_1080160 [Trametes polyzona]
MATNTPSLLARSLARRASQAPKTIQLWAAGPVRRYAQTSRPFDTHVLAELRNASASAQAAPGHGLTPLPELVEQYMKRAGHVLPAALPYESRPSAERRAQFSDIDGAGATVCSADDALVTVVHVVQDKTGRAHKVAYSSGFAVHAPGMPPDEAVLVTCAHTLEEIRHDPLLRAGLPSPAVRRDAHLSGSFVIAGPPTAPVFHPVRAVLSAMHRGDLLLLSAKLSATSATPLRTLPVSPYPVQPGASIRAHFVADKPPAAGSRAGADGWTPWVGGSWRKWARGTVVGYKDFAGREAKPGTYDSLAHLHFDPPPTPGSSGGPIIDEESGAVVGVVLGTQLVSQLQGVRGWGVPAEMIFEMFSLPGLKLKSQE